MTHIEFDDIIAAFLKTMGLKGPSAVSEVLDVLEKHSTDTTVLELIKELRIAVLAFPKKN